MTNRVEYDTAESGLRAVLRDYQKLALRAIWANPEGLGSKAVWDRVNAELKPNTISRASVINFLEAMRRAGADVEHNVYAMGSLMEERLRGFISDL